MANLDETKLSTLVALINELKSDLNALRADFRAHDHAGSYTAATIRVNGVVNTITGTEASTTVAGNAPTNLFQS